MCGSSHNRGPERPIVTTARSKSDINTERYNRVPSQTHSSYSHQQNRPSITANTNNSKNIINMFEPINEEEEDSKSTPNHEELGRPSITITIPSNNANLTSPTFDINFVYINI